MAETRGKRELEEAGFTVVHEVRLKWKKPGRWFEVVTPGGGEDAVMLRQSPTVWHTFYRYEATASGHDPFRALTGGLGDVIATDGQLRTYLDLVLEAPERLLREYDGLYRASSQAYQERHG